MKRQLILILAVFCHSAIARPIERTLNRDERIKIPELGISKIFPKKTETMSSNQKEAVNYVFPWYATPIGLIELAKVFPQTKGTLKERMDASIAHSETRGIKIKQAEQIKLGEIIVIPANCEGTKGFKMKRYYLLNQKGELVFIQVVNSKDIELLEESILKTIQKS